MNGVRLQSTSFKCGTNRSTTGLAQRDVESWGWGRFFLSILFFCFYFRKNVFFNPVNMQLDHRDINDKCN